MKIFIFFILIGCCHLNNSSNETTNPDLFTKTTQMPLEYNGNKSFFDAINTGQPKNQVSTLATNSPAVLKYPMIEATFVSVNASGATYPSAIRSEIAGQKKIGKWQTNCILLNLAGTLNFSYVTKNGEIAFGYLAVPYNARVGRSDCTSNKHQTMQLHWGTAPYRARLRLEFRLWRDVVYLEKLRFVVPLSFAEFPEAKVGQVLRLAYNGKAFHVSSSQSYFCDILKVLPLTKGKKVKSNEEESCSGTFLIDVLQFQAFRVPSDKNFGPLHSCKDIEDQKSGGVHWILIIFSVLSLTGVLCLYGLCRRRYRQKFDLF